MTRTTRRRRSARRARAAVHLALTAAVLLLTLSDAGPATGPGDRTLTVATWNTCGVRHWNCQGTGDAAAKRQVVERLAGSTLGAEVLLLQEICAADLEAVRTALGPSWHAAFRPYTWRNVQAAVTTARCEDPGRSAAGYAILAAHRLTEVRTVPAHQPAVGLQRGILCARLPARNLQVCSAHLTVPGGDAAHPGWEYRDDQLRSLFAAQRRPRAVFGGDLNLDPPGARNPGSWIWPAASRRVWQECDRSSRTGTGRATHVSGHKVDHLFTGLPRTGCEVADTGASDHRALLMTVRTGDG